MQVRKQCANFEATSHFNVVENQLDRCQEPKTQITLDAQISAIQLHIQESESKLS